MSTTPAIPAEELKRISDEAQEKGMKLLSTGNDMDDVGYYVRGHRDGATKEYIHQRFTAPGHHTRGENEECPFCGGTPPLCQYCLTPENQFASLTAERDAYKEALEFAELEIKAMYKRVGISGSNVLTSVTRALNQYPSPKQQDK